MSRYLKIIGHIRLTQFVTGIEENSNMVKVKDLATSKRNYDGSASEAARRWKEEIPKAAWKEAAVAPAAVDLHRVRTMEALDAGRRERGLAEWTDSEWAQRTVAKGGATMAGNMKGSADKWAKKFAPYKSALESVSLPDRTADAMSNIDNRLKPTVQALIDKKRELKG